MGCEGWASRNAPTVPTPVLNSSRLCIISFLQSVEFVDVSCHGPRIQRHAPADFFSISFHFQPDGLD